VATQMHHFVVFEPTWSSPFSREQAEVVEKWLAHPKTVVSADPCAVDGDDYSVNLIYGRAHSENPEPPTPP